MLKQRLLGLALILLTFIMVVYSNDGTIAFLTVPMGLLMIFVDLEEKDGKKV